jgi:hypothetical protein
MPSVVDTLSVSLPAHDVEPVTKPLCYRSPLQKGVECVLHETQLSDSHTSLIDINEFLSVLLTFVCFG